METDYKPGDKPVEKGTVVDYFGSHPHGLYTVVEVHDPGDHPYRRHLDGDMRAYYPDGVAYNIWPVGVPRRFGERDRGVWYVRRTSFRIHEEGSRK